MILCEPVVCHAQSPELSQCYGYKERTCGIGVGPYGISDSGVYDHIAAGIVGIGAYECPVVGYEAKAF